VATGKSSSTSSAPANKYRPVGFVDADPKLAGTIVGGLPVFGGIHLLNKFKIPTPPPVCHHRHRRQPRPLRVCENDRRTRPDIDQRHPPGRDRLRFRRPWPKPRHRGPRRHLRRAKIGDLAIINTAAVVDHECEIGPAAHICPGAHLAGRVRIGSSAFVGLGSNIIQCLTIGDGATVGAGAVVLRDIPAGATAVGVPARIIKVSPALAA